MTCCFLSTLSHPHLRDYMKSKGLGVILLRPAENFEWENAAHPDSLLFELDRQVLAFPEHTDGRSYPGSAALNGLLIGAYFIHNPAITDPPLLKKIREKGYRVIPVSQGYCRCSILKVDEKSVITADWGVEKALREQTDLKVLLCEPGRILLDRHTGFWGGCAGRVEDEVVFHGALKGQPGEEEIRRFIAGRGLRIREFDFPLRDIGGWVIGENLPEGDRIRLFRTK